MNPNLKKKTKIKQNYGGIKASFIRALNPRVLNYMLVSKHKKTREELESVTDLQGEDVSWRMLKFKDGKDGARKQEDQIKILNSSMSLILFFFSNVP